MLLGAIDMHKSMCVCVFLPVFFLPVLVSVCIYTCSTRLLFVVQECMIPKYPMKCDAINYITQYLLCQSYVG